MMSIWKRIRIALKIIRGDRWVADTHEVNYKSLVQTTTMVFTSDTETYLKLEYINKAIPLYR